MSFISDPKIWADRILNDPRWLAESMQRLARFGGQHPTSNVFNHSLEVAYMCRHLSPAGQLWALLHDAHEVLTNDVPRTYKDSSLTITQCNMDQILLERLKIIVPPRDWCEIAEQDELCGNTEANQWDSVVWLWQSWWSDHDNAVDVFVERFWELRR